MYIFNINIKKLSNWMSDILLSGIFVRFFVGQSSKVAGTKPTINLVSLQCGTDKFHFQWFRQPGLIRVGAKICEILAQVGWRAGWYLKTPSPFFGGGASKPTKLFPYVPRRIFNSHDLNLHLGFAYRETVECRWFKSFNFN